MTENEKIVTVTVDTVDNDEQTEPKDSISVVEVVKLHDRKLDQHSVELKVQAEKIKKLEDNALKLENVVMSESRETRMTITNTNQQLHDLIQNLMGYKSGQTQIASTLTMARWESIAKIVGILAGSGGILFYIFGGN